MKISTQACRARGRSRIVLALIVLCLACGAWSPASASWRQEFGGSAGSGSDIANAVTVDAAGDVIAAGVLDNGEDGVAFVVMKLAGASGAVLWRRELAGAAGVEGGALAVTVNAAGDVIAAGELDLDFTVIKFAGSTGDELWRVQIDGTDTFETIEEARAVAIDPAGDVVAAGFVGNMGASRDFFVIKLADADGAELWRQEIDGGDGASDRATAVMIDAAGDVVAAGRLASAGAGADFTVLKLAGASGGELWRRRIDGSASGLDEALAIALDGAGDVVAAGVIDNAATQQDYAVVKLAGGTGGELWRKEADGGGTSSAEMERATAVAIDGSGDVIAAGDLAVLGEETDLTVLKLAGASGNQIWERKIRGAMITARDAAFAVAVDAAGDVIAAGRLENGSRPHFDFSVLKLAGASGTELWRQNVDGTNNFGTGIEETHAVAVDAAGDVVAGGFLNNRPGDEDFTVVKLDGATGVIGPLEGVKIQLRDLAGMPNRRNFSASLRDSTFWAPPAGDLNDPTIAGAEIRIVNPTTLENASLLLPAANWQAVHSTGVPLTYVYSDDGTDGPCTVVQARPHESIRVVCAGRLGLIPFSLDEPTQGELAVTIRFGTAPLQCAVFGGTVTKDAGTGNPGPRGAFKATSVHAALGIACP